MCERIDYEASWKERHTDGDITFQKDHRGERNSVTHLFCPHRRIVRAQVGRIDMAHAYAPNDPDIRVREHHYYMTRASAHRYKVLAGKVKNNCLNAHKPPRSE